MLGAYIQTRPTKHGTCYEVINGDGNVECRTWDEAFAIRYLEILNLRVKAASYA